MFIKTFAQGAGLGACVNRVNWLSGRPVSIMRGGRLARQPAAPSWRNAMRSTGIATRRTAIPSTTSDGPSIMPRCQRTLSTEVRTKRACQTRRVTQTRCGNVPTLSFTALSVQRCQTIISRTTSVSGLVIAWRLCR